MKKATISELKNRLSAYLRLVREGQTVLVCDRNEIIARLERVEREYPEDERLARLESRGLVNRATRPLPLATLRAPAPSPRTSVVAALLEERTEGR